MTEPKYPRRNLYLEADVMDSLREIGDSNASRGVRVAVEYYERNHPETWPPKAIPIDKWCLYGALDEYHQKAILDKPLTLQGKTVDKWYQPEKKAKAQDVPFTFDGEK
jgi:hypothetical protein